ncbi:MAG: 23S rRNA (pseudouridine(1915)-N(3))-methyltransferase RlmH [Candidatus Falkowbacteria bacterium]
MREVTIVAIGKLKESFWQAAWQEYWPRLNAFYKVSLVELSPEKFSGNTVTKAKQVEGERIEAYLQKRAGTEIVLLAEQGKEFDSGELANAIFNKTIPLTLVVAGTAGFSEVILKKYPVHWSLSRLTLPHELARVVLLEQLYRAGTIATEKKYHY